MAKIKLKPKARKGVIGIKALIKHPMETGLRKKKGKVVPANHIVHMVILHNGNTVVDALVALFLKTRTLNLTFLAQKATRSRLNIKTAKVKQVLRLRNLNSFYN